MCEPTTLMMLTIASSMASLAAQKESADSQASSNKKQAANALVGRNENYNQLNLKAVQESEAASQKINDNNIKASEALATSRVSASESGVTGLSVNQMLDNLLQKRDVYNQSVMENNERTQMAIDGQRSNTTISANNTINSLQTPKAPDYAGAGLQIIKGVDKYNTDTTKEKVK